MLGCSLLLRPGMGHGQDVRPADGSALHVEPAGTPPALPDLGELHVDLPLLPGVAVLAHLGHQALSRVAHAVSLHQLLALLIVVGLAGVASSLVE